MLGGITYGELANVPVLAFGESAGGTSASEMAYFYPERTIAYVVEHTRFFSRLSDALDAEGAKKVPGYFRWGRVEITSASKDGYHIQSGAVLDDKLLNGAEVMGVLEARQYHGTKRYAFEEAMGFFALMLPLRYDYQEGVAGKDPVLGRGRTDGTAL